MKAVHNVCSVSLCYEGFHIQCRLIHVHICDCLSYERETYIYPICYLDINRLYKKNRKIWHVPLLRARACCTCKCIGDFYGDKRIG